MKDKFLRITSLFLILMIGFLTTTCKTGTKNTYDSNIKLDNMNRKVSPKEDFYAYVNGGWVAKTEIPADEGYWGSFHELKKKNDKMLFSLIDQTLANEKIDSSTDEGKVVIFFKTAMDTVNVNKNGIKVLQPVLNRINTIKTVEDVTNFFITTESYLGKFLWGVDIYADMKNSNINALYLGEGSLGLPERDYYIENDEGSKKIREKYVAHIARMLQFLGNGKKKAQLQAKRILAFETKMAEAMLSKEESRDPLNTYNPMSLDKIKRIVSLVNWDTYFNGIGLKNLKEIIVSQPNYLKRVNELLKSTPISTIKEYLRWSVLNDAAGYLGKEIESANFDFFGKTMGGLQKMKPRNERVLDIANEALGEALGKLYVKEYFPPEAKNVAIEMVKNIRIAFRERIKNLDWMSDSTKEKAYEKLTAFTVKIGYPDKWKDYNKLIVKGWDEGGSFYNNILNVRKWNFNNDVKKLGKEVDKSEWFMSPQNINAYYNPQYNEIVFPAAILQKPFFSFRADPACNFGGIGAVIGHEITHGFDDQGSKYDANGNLNNWWTDKDKVAFEERGRQLIEQFDAYSPLPKIYVNGKFTLGENIGDLGGVEVAYDGLQLYLSKENDPGIIDGFTQNQRFFMSWATIWRTKYRDQMLKQLINIDPHSPGIYRVIGPLVNVDEFFTAFNIQEGDLMYKSPKDRIRIW